MDGNYTLSDLATVTGSGVGGFGNGGLLILIVLFLLFGGGWGNNRQGDYNQYATAASQQEILFGQQFQTLNTAINKVGDGLASLGYSQLQQMDGNTASINGNITNEGRGIQMQLANCCCENQRNVDSVRYDMANFAAATNANTTAQVQKVLDAIAQNKIETLQGQVSQLQLQAAMTNVVRYPNAWTFNAGTFPCGCNGCNV